MWIIVVHNECEDEAATFVHALVWLDCKGKVEDIVRIREGGLHGSSKGKLSEIFGRQLDSERQRRTTPF